MGLVVFGCGRQREQREQLGEAARRVAVAGKEPGSPELSASGASPSSRAVNSSSVR